ncbi:MAG TPA: SusD/RagB family nutrient-binding outer membrane lipoprotein [Cytophagales bacterium]|jgi:hypothetical protein|nr:SusD/RagB family nutrient-binding outer membrane lipoprotein [Cytophagales bacterium]
MKFNIIKIKTVALVVLIMSGCKNYDTLVVNPNLPTSVPASLLFTSALNDMGSDLAWTSAQEFNQFYISTYTYYGTNNYDQAPFTNSSLNYLTLENVVRMEAEAKKAGAADINPYAALGKFFRAYYFNLMSQKFGDIPVADALEGQLNPTPKYDTQKEVYVQVLQWLDDSNTMLGQLITNKDASLAGDIYLNNNLASWQKVVNAFTLRVLISLSHQSGDTDLDIKQKFSAILSNPTKYPLMADNSDNLKFVYNAAFNPYPKTPGNYLQTNTRENISATILNLTTALNDPRTYVIATPAPAQLNAGKTISDFAAYVGASPGDDMSTLGINSQAGVYSFENALRYASTNDGSNAEPAIIIGYPEMCFNIAEGINLGWFAAGDAATWYVNGITASMNFLGIKDNAVVTIADKSQNVLGTVTVSLTNYLAQTSVQYQGNNTAGLNQILTQKYIAFWQNSGWEAFFNQRRTGMPAFLTGAGTGNNQKLPLRWQYPFSEASANAANYKAAVQSQYSGVDNINGKMWLLQ